MFTNYLGDKFSLMHVSVPDFSIQIIFGFKLGIIVKKYCIFICKKKISEIPFVTV